MRPILSELSYKKHTEDIPLLYTTDVYIKDPVTGSIFTVDSNGDIVYNIKYKANEPVLDELGNIVYRHRAGDVMLDEHGDPILESSMTVGGEVSLLLADAKYLLSTTDIYKEYRDNIANVIYTWCSVNLTAIQSLLLEQTKIYYYPSTSFGSIKVTVNKEKTFNLDSEVYFRVKLYLKDSVKTSEISKEDIIQDIITIIDNYLTNANIYIDDITTIIKNKYSNIITGVQINGMNDDINLYNIQILEEHKRFNLKKKLMLENDGNVYVTEDIAVEFN